MTSQWKKLDWNLGIKNTSLYNKCYQTHEVEDSFLLTYVIHIYWHFWAKCQKPISSALKNNSDILLKGNQFLRSYNTIFMLWFAPELKEEELLFEEHCCYVCCTLSVFWGRWTSSWTIAHWYCKVYSLMNIARCSLTEAVLMLSWLPLWSNSTEPLFSHDCGAYE